MHSRFSIPVSTRHPPGVRKSELVGGAENGSKAASIEDVIDLVDPETGDTLKQIDEQQQGSHNQDNPEQGVARQDQQNLLEFVHGGPRIADLPLPRKPALPPGRQGSTLAGMG
jgi:hypothetical protein